MLCFLRKQAAFYRDNRNTRGRSHGHKLVTDKPAIHRVNEHVHHIINCWESNPYYLFQQSDSLTSELTDQLTSYFISLLAPLCSQLLIFKKSYQNSMLYTYAITINTKGGNHFAESGRQDRNFGLRAAIMSNIYTSQLGLLSNVGSVEIFLWTLCRVWRKG